MSNGKYLEVPDSHRFQHYKDRCAPWIRLHKAVLDDYAFCQLSDEMKFHLIAIWLLASQTQYRVPFDENWIAQQIGANTVVNLSELIEGGFLVVDDAEESG